MCSTRVLIVGAACVEGPISTFALSSEEGKYAEGLTLRMPCCVQTSAVQVFLAVINLILCTQRTPCTTSLSVCIPITLSICILMLEVCSPSPALHATGFLLQVVLHACYACPVVVPLHSHFTAVQHSAAASMIFASAARCLHLLDMSAQNSLY